VPDSHQWVSDRGIEGEVGTVSINPLSSNNVLVQVANTGSLYYSSDHGNTFQYSAVLSNVSWILPVVWHPTNPIIAYTAGFLSNGARQIILMSKNSGASWDPVPSDFPTSQPVEKMAISASNPSVMFASIGSFSFWPWSWSYQALYKSVNGGINWTNLNVMQDDNPKIPKRYISKIAVNPLNESDIFVTLSGFGGGHVWRSVDGGIIWKDFSGNLPDVPANDIVVFNDRVTGDPICMVATDCGVFISQDLRSLTWMELARGLPNSIAMNLDYRQNTLRVRVATHGRGVWEVNLGTSDPTGIRVDKNSGRYLLSQNSPNPFNPSTKIQYEIPVDGIVTMKIFDVCGKEIATPVNGFKKAGMHNIKWDASRFSSGVYFYKLQANDFVTVKRMVFIK
jgi:hypothetical protein